MELRRRRWKKSLNIAVVIIAVFSARLLLSATQKEEVDKMLESIHWLGHASFRLDGPKIIYFDPWKLSKDSKKADLILVTHDHFDHLSLDDIKRIVSKETVVIADDSSAKQIRGKVACKEVRAISPGERTDLEDIGIEAVPSYNIGKAFHPRASKKVGYVVTVSGVSIYHAGDTDFIPEMKDIRCDIALLPVSGTYVMTADEAASAALAIRPKAAIPMHYGDIVGSARDARDFQDALKGRIEVKILKNER